MTSSIRSLGSLLYEMTRQSRPALFGNDFSLFLELGAPGFHIGVGSHQC